ncbi:MAG: tRNA (adenosine(37)-N6)-threonylcarbamoyltransferase complex ATPase subunit type 1 TsaE [Nitrospirota bacterium]
MFSIISTSPEQTWRIGQHLGSRFDAGMTICLYGDLGSGKTNFAYGIARGLDVQEHYITSPTFTFVNEYQGRVPFYHIDLYRLQDPAELSSIGFEHYLDSDGVTVIEWAERAANELPSECLSVYLSQVDDHSREIGLCGEGERYENIIQSLRIELEGKNESRAGLP